MKKKQNLIFLFLLLSLNTIGQIEVYKFKIENPIYFDSLGYIGMEHEFKSERVWLNKNTYYEKNLFSGFADFDKGRIDTFKVINKKYYIKKNSTWQYFFSVEDFKKKKRAKINIAGLDYSLIPAKIQKDNKGKSIYKYRTKPVKEGITTSAQLYYDVDADIGIVKIEGNSTILKRVRVK